VQGDKGDSLMVLSKGDAAVVLEIPGQDETILRQVGRADVVGEMALITREPRTATVRANSAVEAFVLPAADFDDLALKHPQVTVVMTDLLSDRLGQNRIDAFDHKLIEGYRVAGFLARGAMAIVYEVIKEDTQEHLALKMMDHRLIYNADALARFHREAAIAASLTHPNLVKVYDKLECYRTFFLVMEYCDGPSLAQMNEMAGPLPEAEVRKALGQLYLGLTCLHDSGTTHRDVKLSNVLSCSDGTIKLADFGLARPDFEPHLTDAGVVVGTPAFMAPEQFDHTEVGHNIDFYALGCLAYELLTGSQLFDEPTLAATMARKMNLVLPERRAIREDLSEELYAFLQVALSRDPRDRRHDRQQLTSWAGPLDRELVARRNWEAFNLVDASTERIIKDEDGEQRLL
jgi:serine/threonine protein kinase